MKITITDEGKCMSSSNMNYYNEKTAEELLNDISVYNPFSGLILVKKYTEVLGSEMRISKNRLTNNGTCVSFTVKLFKESDKENKLNQKNDSSFMSDDKDDSDIDLDRLINKKRMNNQMISLESGERMLLESDKRDFRGTSRYININKSFENNFFNNINSKSVTSPTNIKNIAQGYNSEPNIYRAADIHWQFSKRRVVVADTDIRNRTLISKLLFELFMKKGESIQIIEARDGAEILQILFLAYESDKYIDALVFDEEMNFISGEFLGEMSFLMKKRSIIPENMCMFMSAHFEILKEEFKGVSLIQKPVEFSSIKTIYDSIIKAKAVT
jgi:hypothetical protein